MDAKERYVGPKKEHRSKPRLACLQRCITRRLGIPAPSLVGQSTAAESGIQYGRQVVVLKLSPGEHFSFVLQI